MARHLSHHLQYALVADAAWHQLLIHHTLACFLIAVTVGNHGQSPGGLPVFI